MIYCNKSYVTLVSFKISYRPALTLLVMTWDDKTPPWRDEGRWVTQACDNASGEDHLLPHGRERGGRWGTADRVCVCSDHCRHEDASRGVSSTYLCRPLRSHLPEGCLPSALTPTGQGHQPEGRSFSCAYSSLLLPWSSASYSCAHILFLFAVQRAFFLWTSQLNPARRNMGCRINPKILIFKGYSISWLLSVAVCDLNIIILSPSFLNPLLFPASITLCGNEFNQWVAC